MLNSRQHPLPMHTENGESLKTGVTIQYTFPHIPNGETRFLKLVELLFLSTEARTKIQWELLLNMYFLKVTNFRQQT